MKDRSRYFSGAGILVGLCLVGAIFAEDRNPPVKSLYVNQGNGIILDKKNDLLWQRCNFGQKLDTRRCLGSARRLKRKEALAYCASLKLGRTKEETARRKWRLPSVDELGSLVRDARARPSIDLELFPGTSPFQYWSGTTFLDNRGLWAYIYSFERSYRFGVAGGVFFARCVSKR